MFKERTVLALVDEESGFLSFQPVNMKQQSVFHCHIFCASSKQESVFCRFQVGFKRKGCFTLIINILHHVAHNLLQCRSYLMAIHMHTCRVSLHNGSMVIKVDNQSRQIVSLTMNQTACIVSLIANQLQRNSKVTGHRKFSYPEIMVYSLMFECKHSYSYTTYLIMSGCNILLVGSIYFHHLTLFRFTGDFCYCSRENPGMKTK